MVLVDLSVNLLQILLTTTFLALRGRQSVHATSKHVFHHRDHFFSLSLSGNWQLTSNWDSFMIEQHPSVCQNQINWGCQFILELRFSDFQMEQLQQSSMCQNQINWCCQFISKFWFSDLPNRTITTIPRCAKIRWIVVANYN